MIASTVPSVNSVPRGESGLILRSRSIDASLRAARLRLNNPAPWITTQITIITIVMANWIMIWLKAAMFSRAAAR